MKGSMSDELVPEQHVHNGEHSCIYCGDSSKIELPKQLIKACLEGSLVIFAGAGISTENEEIFGSLFYDEIWAELDIDEKLSFPDLMSRYCEEFDRRQMLKEIKKRFDYLERFSELKSVVARFHAAVATIPQVKDIITTNWDTLFETECQALPIVTSEDFAFVDLDLRKVLKIHGSMSNVGSIVATREDYKKCFKDLQNGPVGARLKQLLASKTIVFVGYSLRDEDFSQIYEYLQDELGDLMPKSYIVNPYELDNPYSRLVHIKTTGVNFAENLKTSLVEKKAMISESSIAIIEIALQHFVAAHLQLTNEVILKNCPEAIWGISYQDGLINAFKSILATYKSGVYGDRKYVIDKIHDYQHLYRGAILDELYFDAAYIFGYIAGHQFYLTIEDDIEVLRDFPMYFTFHEEEPEFEDMYQYLSFLNSIASSKSDTYRGAEEIVKKWPSGMVPQHAPRLSGVRPDFEIEDD